jgi:AraC-like DNA-binding protein
LAVVPLVRGSVFQTSRLGHCALAYFCLHLEQLVGLLSTRERALLDATLLSAAPGGRFLRADHPCAQRFQALLDRATNRRLWTRFQCISLFADVFAPELEQVRAWGSLALTARDRFDHWAATVSEAEIQCASLGDLAKRCGCSPRHFSRLFRVRFGLSRTYG